MQADLEEIDSIIEEADELQARLDKLETRQTFSLDQHVAIRACANTLRGFRGYDLAQIKVLFDPEYADQMKRLTEAAKGKGL